MPNTEREETVVYGKKVYISCPSGSMNEKGLEWLAGFLDTNLARIHIGSLGIGDLVPALGLRITGDELIDSETIRAGYDAAEGIVTLKLNDKRLQGMTDDPSLWQTVIQHASAGTVAAGVCCVARNEGIDGIDGVEVYRGEFDRMAMVFEQYLRSQSLEGKIITSKGLRPLEKDGEVWQEGH